MKNPKSLHVKATAIKQEGNLLQQFLQLISDLWCMVSEDGYYQHLNADVWENLLGWNESELIAKPMLSFVHPEDVEATSKALSKLVKNQVVELNVRHRHKDGSFRPYCWRINKNEDELIYGIGKEITCEELQHQLKLQSYLVRHESTDELLESVSQKVELIQDKLQQAEQKLDFLQINQKLNSSNIADFYKLQSQIEDAVSNKKLLESFFASYKENSLEKIIANMPQGILLLNSEYQVILANQNGRDYLNLCGKIDSRNILHKIGEKGIEELTINYAEKIAWKFVPQDSSNLNFKITIQMLISQTNRNQWLVTISDMSNYCQNNLEIHKALEKEKELSLIKSNVLNTVSHEYRTPLTNIILAVQLLKKYHGELDSNRQMRCLEYIENSSKYLAQLVDNMLLVNQAEFGKLKLHRTPLDLVSFTKQLLENFQLVRDSQYNINFTYECFCSQAYLDSTLLRQIITNLLSNAIKYSPDGTEINLHLDCKNNIALFKIKDRGIGIHEEDKQNIFESFQRGSNASTIRGTGLGLAIVKKSVELHGGEIWFDSVAGNGTTFYIKLPC